MPLTGGMPALRDFLEEPAAERARLVKPDVGDAEPSLRARRRAAS